MGGFSFLLLALLVFAPSVWAWKRMRAERERILRVFKIDASLGLSVVAEDYIIPSDGTKRSNKVERRFRRRFFFDLLEVYDHSCANCKQAKTKLEMDHFFVPKSFGGNLMLKHKKGYWVSNGILLCRRCNGNKADKSIEDYFEEDILKEILLKNTRMSFIINGLEPREFQEPRTLSSDP